MLLEEEVRWLKAQYYGRSTQSTDAAEQNADQTMLFNEAEVLAAIEAADEAHRERTTKIDAHERKRSADAAPQGDPGALPAHRDRTRSGARSKNVHEVRRAASLDPHRPRDPRVLSLRAAEDQRRAAHPPDLRVRRAARGADHGAGAARHPAEVDGEPLLARARHELQVQPRACRSTG